MTLREALEKKGWTVIQLAWAYKCSSAYIYEILKAGRAGKKTLLALSKATGETITGI